MESNDSQMESTDKFVFWPHVVGGDGLRPGFEWHMLPSLIHEDLDHYSNGSS